jgi:hypothetical protein
MAAKITRRVRVFKLPTTAWERPGDLEKVLTATLGPNEKIVAAVPGPKMTALLLITEE